MKQARRADRRDDNEADLVRLARHLGALWIGMPAGVGFDGVLVNKMGEIFLVEIKDGAKPPSARKLTGLEKELADNLAHLGASLSVIKDEDEMASICEVPFAGSFPGFEDE